jgi:CheY-like chemotaxis protein
LKKITKTFPQANDIFHGQLPGRIPALNSKESPKPMVLVVEDNEELLSFIAESLETNWQVLKAANGQAAWEIIINELPDYVISDVMMPGMNGYELCEKVKKDPRTGHIFFLLLTAKAGTESRLKGLQGGADEYLTKPFHFDELELRLYNLLKQQARLQFHFRHQVLPEAPLKTIPHLDDAFIKQLYEQLDLLLIDPGFSVEALAKKMTMSQRTLNRKLKAILNITPVEFIRRYRLQKAAILISSGHSISEAAYAVGFDTASYFSHCFKEEYGKTPTEFLGQKTV